MTTTGWASRRQISVVAAIAALCACGHSNPSTTDGGATTKPTGTPCAADGTCADPNAACVGGFCVDTPPPNPQCFTPCLSSFVDDAGTYHTCPPSGLMAGCVGGFACASGSCASPAAPPPTCNQDVDCASALCANDGHCYYTCGYDGGIQCPEGAACYQNVCRTICTDSGGCQGGMGCEPEADGLSYCLPTVPSSGTPQTSVPGSYTLETPDGGPESGDALAFTNSAPSGTIVLVNNSPTAQEFTVTKVQHTEYRSTGQVTVTTNPLSWLLMGEDTASQVQQLTVEVDSGASANLVFSGANNPTLQLWDGVIQISNSLLGNRTVPLSYRGRPDGQWAGTIYYFQNFSDVNLAGWLAQKNDSNLQAVGNALIQRWGALMGGRMSFNEFSAALQATETGSWQWGSVETICPSGDQCYLYSNPQGYDVYTTDPQTVPIPTGVSELPIAMNLEISASDPKTFSGEIVTDQSLQYPGYPAVTLTFSDDPTTCNPASTADCLAEIGGLTANFVVGGRYATTASDTGCRAVVQDGGGANTFALVQYPWLVPGFTDGTSVDPTTGLTYRYECRDNSQPLGTATTVQATNLSLAQANPIPDGTSRKRDLELLDGALIDQNTLFVLFREHFASFLGSDPAADDFYAYGYMILARQVASLDSSAYAGSVQADTRPAPQGILSTSCDPALLALIGDTDGGISPESIAAGMLNGVVVNSSPVPVGGPGDTTEEVHYLCDSTGQIDGAPDGFGDTVPCPAGSGVTYFTLTAGFMTEADIGALPCQDTTAVLDGGMASCQSQLEQWQNNAVSGIRLDPAQCCEAAGLTTLPATCSTSSGLNSCCNSQAIFCDPDRNDMRQGKVFFAASGQPPAFPPIYAAISDAFRYKTQFQNRQGTSVGFAPQQCVPDSDAVPYCYDPIAISQLDQRVDCLVNLYDADVNQGVSLGGQEGAVQQFLQFALGQQQDNSTSPPTESEGFESLDAELLIMLGDEAYTDALASRFDLAGSETASFQGSLFEPNGIDLSGGAGFEMYLLYEAAQYYQMVLDRFYSLSPSLWRAVNAPAAQTYITENTVAIYFDKLVDASTQKAQAWMAVAQQYQGFNRPDLAQLVAQRAYISAYLESILLSRLMLKVEGVAQNADLPQIVSELNLSALNYKSALLNMRSTYQTITDNLTYFGFEPDYVPFPALDPTTDTADVNGFTKIFSEAQEAAGVAVVAENAALTASSSYNTDAAAFQAELVTLQNQYETQLSSICGTFTGTDGVVYPAISTYAQLNPQAQALGDPCGWMGNGQINDALGTYQVDALALQEAAQKIAAKVQEITIEQQEVSAQCNEDVTIANYQFNAAGTITTLQDQVGTAQEEQQGAELLYNKAVQNMSAAGCITIVGTADGTNCPQSIVAQVAWGAVAAVAAAGVAATQLEINSTQDQIAADQAATAQWTTEQQCVFAQIDGNAQTQTLALDLVSLQLEAQKADYVLRLAASNIVGLENQAKQLLAQEQAMQQQTINVEAAQNDPDTRVYKNDSVVTADQTFQTALQDAYLATVVFQYYSSQSYASLSDLFLVRMVQYGQPNLNSYLTSLSNAYDTFRESYGSPDLRVAVVSLRDDVLVPALGSDGSAMSVSQRVAALRSALTDPSHLDENGYLNFSFSTSLAQLSPLTFDHKIDHLQVGIEGDPSGLGDDLGRVYLEQEGTGTVRASDSSSSYYRFPELLAVVNPMFNGTMPLDPSVYVDERLRDRPFVNTEWKLILNQKDETVNQDIDLNSISDIKLYVYYTDFTTLPGSGE